jgi:hypothetical protein
VASARLAQRSLTQLILPADRPAVVAAWIGVQALPQALADLAPAVAEPDALC